MYQVVVGRLTAAGSKVSKLKMQILFRGHAHTASEHPAIFGGILYVYAHM